VGLRQVFIVPIRRTLSVLKSLTGPVFFVVFLVLEGEVRVTAIDYEGGNFIDDLKKGDLWYFPSGVPHSLQGLGENGTEFLLVFDDGNFSEESTFILTDWLGELRLPFLPTNAIEGVFIVPG